MKNIIQRILWSGSEGIQKLQLAVCGHTASADNRQTFFVNLFHNVCHMWSDPGAEEQIIFSVFQPCGIEEQKWTMNDGIGVVQRGVQHAGGGIELWKYGLKLCQSGCGIAGMDAGQRHGLLDGL